ncbi:MAG: hypothetical protein IIC50_24125 [Planctomycetes bacterium]|nr:hypothetical protein [Planctomycetota bacterium]
MALSTVAMRLKTRTSSADQFVIFGMRPDPQPKTALRDSDRQGTVSDPDSDRAKTTDLLEVKARMIRVLLEKFEVLIR